MALVDSPDIQLVDEDVSMTLANMITVYEALTGRTMSPGNPERLFLHSLAAIIVQQRSLINLTRKATLLKFAAGIMLDHLGAFSQTTRLPAEAAFTVVRFTLSAPQTSTITIPAGTRVSTQAEPKKYFATSIAVIIAAGGTTVDVSATCTEAGSAGNGFIAGQISQLVDSNLPFVASAVNTAVSGGGVDIESDDAYRQRIYESPESFSVAGPEGAYRYWAKSANSAIVDVSVTSPTPGVVQVAPLLAGGVIPSSVVLDDVAAIFADRSVRPMTDEVNVVAPTTQSYTITYTYYIERGRAAEETAIQAAVLQAEADFVMWQKSKLGRDINPSELIRRLMAAGAYRVNLTSPVYVAVDDTKVAVAGTVTRTYGGLTND